MIITIYIISIIFTYLVLRYDDDIKISILSSFVLGDEFAEKNKTILLILAAVLSPITLIEIIYIKIKSKEKLKIKINMKQIITVLVLILLGYGITQGIKSEVKYYNQSVSLQMEYKKTINKRLTVIDRITKIVHQKLEVAKMNDSSYYKNLAIIATSRADKQGLFMKWVTENNPNANYDEVAQLYRDVTASVVAERDQLQAVENEAQDIVYSYDKLQNEFPSSIYLYYRPKQLNYEPISTDFNKEVNKTGVDNNVSL